MDYQNKSSGANEENFSNTHVSESEDVKKGILTTLHDLVALLAGILMIFSLCFRIVIVSGPSMNNTLMDGDWILLISNVFYRDIGRGDIIVASKDDFKDGEPIIKRVIATEGQMVDIDFHRGIVYVDGVALDEPYALSPTYMSEGVSFPIIVDSGCVFVMGDNRNNSKDSRSNEIGLIDKREIIGKAVFILFPGRNDLEQREFNRIGGL